MKAEPRGRNAPLRMAFVMEQALGHVTHSHNLHEVASHASEIAALWLPIPFEVTGAARIVPMLRSNWSVRSSWRARRALDGAAAARSLDAVFFHTQTASLFSTNVMRRVPSVISLDATPTNYDSLAQQYAHKAANTGFLDRKKYELNRRAFHAASGLVAWSDWARRSLIEDYAVEPGRIRVVPPGASRAFFDIGETRLGQDDAGASRVRLLFVGADFERKGGPLVLELMRGPLAQSCELHIVTQSPVPPEPNVFVHRGLGPNSPILQRLFAQADVFVLPTHADCLGIVVEEAAAAGLPVVTTNVGGVGEGVSNGVSGLVIRPGDVAELHAALSLLVDDVHFRCQTGRAAHALARQKFDASRNNRAVLDFMLEIVEARPSLRRVA